MEIQNNSHESNNGYELYGRPAVSSSCYKIVHLNISSTFKSLIRYNVPEM